MDLELLRKQLEKSTRAYTIVEDKFKNHVKNEVEALNALLSYLMPALPVEYINGKRAVLIYVYDDSGKKTISNKVYYCEDRKIRYQVFKRDEYMGYNPTVQYDGAYAVVDAEEHFSKRNGLELSDVVDFFLERVDTLKEITDHVNQGTEIRYQYLTTFKKAVKGIL